MSDGFDILLARERIRGESRMIPEGTDPAKITEEQIAHVIHQTKLFCEQYGISQIKLGRAIGASSTRISEVLNGRYKADRRPIIQQIDAWLEAEAKRQAIPRDDRFVATSVSREIFTVAQLVSQLKTIGLIYGPDSSGIGKTMALRAVHEETPGSILVILERRHANATGLWRSIANAMKVPAGVSSTDAYDNIKSELRDTPRLLIVDQIQALRGSKGDAPLYQLADLHDITGAPQLWSGTADMVSYLNRGVDKGDESLTQLRTRIGVRRDLLQRTRSRNEGGRDEPLYTVEDIRRVFGNNKLRLTPPAVQMLWQMACTPDGGALRLARNVVRLATMTAEGLGAAHVEPPHLQAALQNLIQPDEYVGFVKSLDLPVNFKIAQ